jgi:hypothetical protein
VNIEMFSLFNCWEIRWMRWACAEDKGLTFKSFLSKICFLARKYPAKEMRTTWRILYLFKLLNLNTRFELTWKTVFKSIQTGVPDIVTKPPYSVKSVSCTHHGSTRSNLVDNLYSVSGLLTR